ncbi:MAG: saccharopine dehydrogenase NADP-binding domain-containing protein [Gammaproteobacteria bacterium]|jgi:short subunit dehydrogenase-like uncharacterized protein
MSEILIYGSYGYTGELIVARMRERGLRPLLAGRNTDALRSQADRYGLDYRVVRQADSAALAGAMGEARALLNCAGPFIHTYRAAVRACLAKGAHYLDITGEIPVFEGLAVLDAEARRQEIMLLPGTGFDVVPTDCLAAHLKERLPEARSLALAFYGGGGLSRGTRRTMAEGLGEPGAARREGRIIQIPPAWHERRIDFGDGRTRTAVTIPWGDVSTAFYSTGIPDIEVYTVMPRSSRRMLRATRYVGWMLRFPLLRRWLVARAGRGPAGPSDERRERSESLLWGEARDPHGRVAVSRLRCENGYTLTARSAVTIAERVLGGQFKPGFQTPSRVYGADFILELGGHWTDDPIR